MKNSLGQSWETCDKDIKLFIESLVTQVGEFLNNDLIGIYLHGSLTMASYYRPKSDIDIFIVVEKPMDTPRARDLNLLIAKHSENRPTTSTFELNVITSDTAKHPRSPLPFELHYSVGWHSKILNDEMDYSSKQTDVDLVAQLMYAVRHGICLYGKPISEVFGKVVWSDYIEAVLADYHKIIHDEDIVKMPINNILNVCRVLQLLQQETTDVHNKDEGAAWGLSNLPPEFRPLIQKALSTYHSSQTVSVQDRKTGGITWDKDELLAFRDFARTAITDYDTVVS